MSSRDTSARCDVGGHVSSRDTSARYDVRTRRLILSQEQNVSTYYFTNDYPQSPDSVHAAFSASVGAGDFREFAIPVPARCPARGTNRWTLAIVALLEIMLRLLSEAIYHSVYACKIPTFLELNPIGLILLLVQQVFYVYRNCHKFITVCSLFYCSIDVNYLSLWQHLCIKAVREIEYFWGYG